MGKQLGVPQGYKKEKSQNRNAFPPLLSQQPKPLSTMQKRGATTSRRSSSPPPRENNCYEDPNSVYTDQNPRYQNTTNMTSVRLSKSRPITSNFINSNENTEKLSLNKNFRLQEAEQIQKDNYALAKRLYQGQPCIVLRRNTEYDFRKHQKYLRTL